MTWPSYIVYTVQLSGILLCKSYGSSACTAVILFVLYISLNQTRQRPQFGSNDWCAGVNLNKEYGVMPFCPFDQGLVHMGFIPIIQNKGWLRRRPNVLDEKVGQVALKYLTFGPSSFRHLSLRSWCRIVYDIWVPAWKLILVNIRIFFSIEWLTIPPFFKGEGNILPAILSMLKLYNEELLKGHTWYLCVKITKMCLNFDQRSFQQL